jgi:hypothetical protein
MYRTSSGHQMAQPGVFMYIFLKSLSAHMSLMEWLPPLGLGSMCCAAPCCAVQWAPLRLCEGLAVLTAYDRLASLLYLLSNSSCSNAPQNPAQLIGWGIDSDGWLEAEASLQQAVPSMSDRAGLGGELQDVFAAMAQLAQRDSVDKEALAFLSALKVGTFSKGSISISALARGTRHTAWRPLHMASWQYFCLQGSVWLLAPAPPQLHGRQCIMLRRQYVTRSKVSPAYQPDIPCCAVWLCACSLCKRL